MTINYAPEPSGTAPYTTAMAERLAAIGYQVSAIAGMPHYPSWSIARRYRGRLSANEFRNGVRLLRFANYVPRRQSAASRALYEGSFLVNAARATLTLPQPDAILGIVPTLSDAVLARVLAARHRVPYGIIFQDVMGRLAAQSGIAGGGGVAGAITRVEGWSARGARAVATVAERFIPYLEGLGVARDRIVHLPNWTHLPASNGHRPETRARFGWRDDDVVVLHAGNMGLKQDLQQVLAAARLASTRDTGARFVFVGDGNQRELLQREAADLPNVEFHPSQPASAFTQILAAADVLLVSERASAIDMSLPSKLTSYFAVGRPVVAAVSPSGATAREVERSGAGMVVPSGEPQALLDAVLRLRADHALARRLGETGRAYAAETLNPETAMLRAEHFVGRLMGGAAPSPQQEYRS